MNGAGIPDRAVIALGATAGAVTVNVIAARRAPERRLVSWAGAVGAGLAALVLGVRLLMTRPLALALLVAMVLLATLGRPRLLARVTRSHRWATTPS